MKERFAILTTGGYRDPNRTLAVRQWAESRGLQPVELPVERLPGASWDGVALCWHPAARENAALLDVPEHVPVVVDYDWASQDESLAAARGARPLAIRRVFHNNRPSGVKVDFETAYWHAPRQLPASPRKDVVIFDISSQEMRSVNAQVLAMLASLEDHWDRLAAQLGVPLRCYFANMLDPAPWLRAAQALFQSSDPLPRIAKTLLPPAAAPAGYDAILARCRLFVTNSADLADLGLFEAAMGGIPIAPIAPPFTGSRHITYSMDELANHLEPQLPALVAAVNEQLRVDLHHQGQDALTRTPPAPLAPAHLETAHRLFRRTWDDVLAWARGEAVDPAYARYGQFASQVTILNDHASLQSMLRQLPATATVGVFGASQGLAARWPWIHAALEGRPMMLFDNDAEKWGREFLGCVIRSPQDLVATPPQCVLITSTYYRAIGEQLLELQRRQGLQFPIHVVNYTLHPHDFAI